MEWEPISSEEIYEKIKLYESEIHGQLLNFWTMIKIEPEKWSEEQYGKEGEGFWVVAICGRKVIWYNDIEEGFNISQYCNYGKIDEYYCNQDDLNWIVAKLFNEIKFSGIAFPNRK